MQLEDIKKLAELARLDMTEEEMTNLAKDFDPILAYVGQIKEVFENLKTKSNYSVKNVVREDVVTNEGGLYSDKIIAQFPDKEDGYLKVKQIL